jgi:uncharacterized protein (TIGR01777 family)
VAPLRVLIAGASGLIGTELSQHLWSKGHVVTRLVRDQPTAADEVRWDAKSLDPAVLDGIDAVINLSGATVGRIPWTPAYRRVLLNSRVDATTALAEAIVAAKTPPHTFLSASAVGYYGTRPGEELTEESPGGDDFFADLVEAWEKAAAIAAGGTRVVNMRSAVIVAHGGGWAPIRVLTSFGLGSRFGNGKQYWPWIALTDEVAAITHLLTSRLSGPVILSSPTPTTSDEVTRAYATALRRPYFLRLPRIAAKALGEAGDRLLLVDEKVHPTRLEADGFRWKLPTIDEAIAATLEE